MKKKSILTFGGLLALAVFTCESSLAATFQWDGDGGTAGAQDGGGTWNTTNTNWVNATNVAWTDTNSAVFGIGSDGTYAVDVGLSPTASSLVFNKSGYAFSAASAQTVTVSSTTNSITTSAIVVAAGKSATIGNNLTVTTPSLDQNYYISGGGTLIVDNGGALKGNSTLVNKILYLNASTLEVKTGGAVTTLYISGSGSALFINGTLNVTGGTVSAPGTLGLGQTSGVMAGTLNLDSGNVNATSSNGIRIGGTSTTATTPGGTVNLNGGILTVFKIWKGGPMVTTSILNLNGGTLKPSASSDLITGLDRANVRNYGVTIDTGSFGTIISQALLHSDISGDAATDGGLVKNGTSSLLLTGLNTYTGGTTVNAGAVEFGVGAVPSSGQITLNSAGSLKVTGSTANGAFPTVASVLSSGAVSTSSTGALALTPPVVTEQFSENIDFGAYSSLMLGAKLNATYSGLLTTAGDSYHLGGGGAVLTVTGANALTGSKNLVIGATGATGTVLIANSNNFTGATTITSGTLQLGDSVTALADGLLPNTSGITNNSILWFDVVGSVAAPANISGAGSLKKLGSGTLTMATANSYSGPTSIDRGIVSVTHSGAFGTSTISVNGTEHQLLLSGDITLTNPLRCNGVGPGGVSGVLKSISGNNTVTDFGFAAVSGTRINVSSGSTLTLPNDFAAGNLSSFRAIGSGILVLNGNNSGAIGAAQTFYLGSSTLAGATTVKAGNDLALGGGIISFDATATLQSKDASARTFANPVLFNGTTATLGSATTGNLTFAGGAVTVGNNLDLTINNATTTFTGAVVESGGARNLTKFGPGTLALAGATSLTGAIAVTGGTLLANASISATGGVTVNTGATLGGSGPINPNITVNSGGFIAPGNSTGTLAALGAVALSGSLKIEIDGAAADRLNVTGALDLSNATLDVTTLAGGATQPVYVIASFGSLTGSAFANVNGLPAGYTVSYDLTSHQVQLVAGAPAGLASWIAANYPLLADKTATGDPDGDGKTNLMEYAFGTDPGVSSAGSIAYVAGGEVTAPGQPVAVNFASGGGVDFRAVFGRRNDYQAAGLSYTVQFSAGLDHWVNNMVTPTLVTGAASAGDIDAMSVPYPALITTTQGDVKPTFFRVAVSETP